MLGRWVRDELEVILAVVGIIASYSLYEPRYSEDSPDPNTHLIEG